MVHLLLGCPGPVLAPTITDQVLTANTQVIILHLIPANRKVSMKKYQAQLSKETRKY